MTEPQGLICEHLLLLVDCVKVSSVFMVTFFLLYIILCIYCILACSFVEGFYFSKLRGYCM